MTESERVTLESMDIAEEKRARLKSLFPEVFTEDKVDFEQLQRVLGEWVDPGKERFGLSWPGKAECMKIIQQPSIATLKPARDESVNFDDTENLFIEGDNLEVLKLLQKSYFGKVKMIYIDPPYNTGKEFIYPDKYSETLDTYLEYTGQKDGDGHKFSTNTDAAGRYHSRWLNMMYPRLYLARNLLREDGGIFISIDDNEQDNLRKLCDEIFGEENFIASIIWEKVHTRKNSAKYFSISHEYILSYSKNKESWSRILLPRDKKNLSNYKNPDNHPKGPWKLDPVTAHNEYNADYKITKPNGVILSRPQGRYWSFSEATIKQKIANNEIEWGDGNSYPMIKRFLSEAQDGLVPVTLFDRKFAGDSSVSKKEIDSLLALKGIFDYTKPSLLIRRLMQITCSKDDIILDFFAGSGTLGHAALEHNKEQQTNCKYICVQLPEPCAEQSEAYKADYKTIADIGKERIRRAAKKIEKEQSSQLDLHSDTKPDLGFKVFKLARSNFKVWEGDTEKIENFEQQLFDHVDHIDDASEPEAILYELLLKSGFPLTTKVGKRTFFGKEVFSIEQDALLICLDKNLTQEVIDAIADANPLQVICLDEGFKGNDQLKTNAVQTFKSRAQQEDGQIVFRTV